MMRPGVMVLSGQVWLNSLAGVLILSTILFHSCLFVGVSRLSGGLRPLSLAVGALTTGVNMVPYANGESLAWRPMAAVTRNVSYWLVIKQRTKSKHVIVGLQSHNLLLRGLIRWWTTHGMTCCKPFGTISGSLGARHHITT